MDTYSLGHTEIIIGSDTTIPFSYPTDPLKSGLAALYSSSNELSLQSFEAETAFLSGEQAGIFTVDDSGWVHIDFLLDGGSYQGQVGLFSLADMEHLDRDTFIAEATSRVTGNDPRLGSIVI
ncbi:MAG: hypothetical protein AAGB19_21515, partial [Cyanobacteria bacterium P01_F01_bin.3]